MATKALTSAAIVGSGDVACQTLFEGRSLQRGGAARPQGDAATAVADCGIGADCDAFDHVRLGNMTLLGAVLVAPVLHVWYGFLGRKIPGTAVGPVVGRVFLDQALFAPVFIAVFFSALAVSECCLSWHFPCACMSICQQRGYDGYTVCAGPGGEEPTGA